MQPPQVQHRGRWAMYTDETATSCNQSQTTSQVFSHPLQRNTPPCVWHTDNALQRRDNSSMRQMQSGDWQGTQLAFQATQSCSSWQQPTQPASGQQQSQHLGQATWSRFQGEIRSPAPLQNLYQEKQHSERPDTTRITCHTPSQLFRQQPNLFEVPKLQPCPLPVNKAIQQGIFKIHTNATDSTKQQQGMALNPVHQHTDHASMRPFYEHQSSQTVQLVQQAVQPWRSSARLRASNSFCEVGGDQQSAQNVVRGVNKLSVQASRHEEAAIVSTLSPGDMAMGNKSTWKKYTAEDEHSGKENVNQKPSLNGGSKQANKAVRASNSFDSVHVGKPKNILKQSQLPFVTLQKSKTENSASTGMLNIINCGNPKPCKEQAITSTTKAVSNARTATQKRGSYSEEVARTNAAGVTAKLKKPRLSGRSSGKATKANCIAAKQAQVLSDLQQCQEDLGLGTYASSCISNDMVVNTQLPGGVARLSNAIASCKAVVMGVLYRCTVKSQAASIKTQPGTRAMGSDNLSATQYYTGAQEQLPKCQEKLLVKARKLITKFESMAVAAEEDQLADEDSTNADASSCQETKAVGIGLLCFPQSRMPQIGIAAQAAGNIPQHINTEKNNNLDHSAGPLFYIPLPEDSDEEAARTEARKHASAALKILTDLLQGTHVANNTQSPASVKGNFVQAGNTAGPGRVDKPLVVCADSKGLVRELIAAGVQLHVPFHELNIVDPCVLAWLATPHLVQKDEKQTVASYCVTCLADYHNIRATCPMLALDSTTSAAGRHKNAKETVAHACESLQAQPPLLRLRQGCLMSFQLMNMMVPQIQGWLPQKAVKLEMQVSLLLGVMEARGVCLDMRLLASWTARVKQRVQSLHAQACAAAGKDFNPASALQLADVLYTHLRLPPPNSQAGRNAPKTHAPTDEKALKQLSKHHSLPDIILDYRCMMSVLTKYLQADWVQAAMQGANKRGNEGRNDNIRVHCSWNCLNTATGRLSSSAPNLQAVTKYIVQVDTGAKQAGRSSGAMVAVDADPKQQHTPAAAVTMPLVINVRDAFVASAGRVLISADYSQIELRVLAHVSGDKELNKLLHCVGPRGDCFQLIAASWPTQQPSQHIQEGGGGSNNANKQGPSYDRTQLRKLTGITHDASTAYVSKEDRELAKRITYGIIYGLTQHGLQQHLSSQGIDLAQASALRESFLNHFSGVKAFVERCKAEAKQQGYVTTLMGRRRPLPGLRSTDLTVRADTDRKVVNSIVQGSAADIMKLAMVQFEQWCASYGKAAQLQTQTASFTVPQHRQPSPPSQSKPGGGATTAASPYTNQQHRCQTSDLRVCLQDIQQHAKSLTQQQVSAPPLLVAQIHDELLVECADDPGVVMQVAAALHTIMSGVVSLSVPLNVNIFVGRSWGTMEKLETYVGESS